MTRQQRDLVALLSVMALLQGCASCLDAVRFEHQERKLWGIWVPPFPAIFKYETSTRLAFDVSLMDAQARPVWKRTYDDDAGRVVWTSSSADSTPLPNDIGRLAKSRWLPARRRHDTPISTRLANPARRGAPNALW